MSRCSCRGDAALGRILWVKREAANTEAAGVDDGCWLLPEAAPLKGRRCPNAGIRKTRNICRVCERLRSANSGGG